MRKAFWCILCIALITGTTSAFSASIDSQNQQASPESPALFSVEVLNNGQETQIYQLSHTLSKSGWVYYDTSKQIRPGESKTFNISVNPGESAVQQSYNMDLFVQELRTGEQEKFSTVVNVDRQKLINVKNIEYPPETVSPGEKFSASITVQNLASTILNDYTVQFELENRTESRNGVAFAPGALKTYSFKHQIPQSSRPQDKKFSVTVTQDDDQVTEFTRTLSVNQVRNVTTINNRSGNGIRTTGILEIRNNGNSEVSVSENVTLPGYVDPILFFGEEPSYSASQRGERVYTWNKTLQPGEKFSTSYSIEYWIPFILTIIIILGIALIREITGSISITKEKEKTEDGHKVSIQIENRSSEAKETVKIEDFVPNVVSLIKDFEVAEPEMKNTTEGVELSWSLEDLKPGETRIITYKVTDKVEVEDGLDLPSAKIVEDGKTVSKS
ncbi:hypothetical protein GLU26_01600 [Nanohaloarchaea archaeon]|nr:hypothetical protein [Candidatus Nanohaloarchaea archaeon]